MVTLRGTVVAWEFDSVSLHVYADGRAEQNPDDWFDAFLSTARRLLARPEARGREVLAIACSTQGECTVAVDRDGRPLMGAVLWMDTRGRAWLPEIIGGAPRVAGYNLFRLARWIRVTGGAPSLTGKDPAGHMLLIKNAFPEVYAQTHRFLNALDYMNFRLTGRFVATVDSILTSWVTDNRDPGRIHYHAGLVRDSGIDGAKLPEIVPCTEIIGTLLPNVAEGLGLPADTPVVAGAIDNTAAAIGAGSVEDYALHGCIGTSSWLAAHVPHKKTDIFSSLASVPCAVPGRYLLTALQATAGGNLSFLRDKVFFNNDALGAPGDPAAAYRQMDEMVEGTPPGSNGVVYAPWIFGERAPVEDPTVRAAFFNLSLENDRCDIVRAAYEGVALNTRWLMGPVNRFLGRETETINLVGGGSHSAPWCQIFADVLGVTVRQVEDGIQANARGAALIAAMALGHLDVGAVPDCVPIARDYSPNPALRGLYQERFETLVAFYKANRGLYRRLNR